MAVLFPATPRALSAATNLSGFRPNATLAGPVYRYAGVGLVNKVANLRQHSVAYLHIEQLGRLGDLEILFKILKHRGTKFRSLAQ